jgi:uncharacterized protein (DUF488 family)
MEQVPSVVSTLGAILLTRIRIFKLNHSHIKDNLLIQTIGHSTRTLEEFSRLLNIYAVTKIADIRTIPRSRHNPQFNIETLPGELARLKIGYAHIPGLGGLRHPDADSVNSGWRNTSFRGFADYMQTTEFKTNLEQTINLARLDSMALMCAEAVPWRCHRSLIADALTIRGIQVEHILSTSRRSAHQLTLFAKVEGLQISYPSGN